MDNVGVVYRTPDDLGKYGNEEAALKA